ncbi:thioesterase family protein [Corynebacterium poyangense]|uniref:Thioesterase family protein n=1 Tax=Corynebacterium poyangense TaxID=2684405 RepID=A0A7H0SMW5_9CORY|nr:thioesterase family protein [Corynebacterium poyangense]QNQ89890.1 thioesterase family protein [Corynebacterium poyangense]
MDSYFIRTGAQQYTATSATTGAWNTSEQHIAPSLGLILHIAETDFAVRRTDHLSIGRVTYEIYGVVPIDVYDYQVEVIRKGKTIELVEVRLLHEGRTIVQAHIWFMVSSDTQAVAGTAIESITPRSQMQPFAPVQDWQGDFLETLEGFRTELDTGRAHMWVRTNTLLVDDQPASPFSLAASMFDIANGMALRANPKEVMFPNVDLSAHFFRVPDFHEVENGFSDWLGHDIRANFGPTGLGLTHNFLHDKHGPFGVMAQCLTVRIP